MEYDDSDRARELTDRARELMEDVVLPTERNRPGGEPITRDVTNRLREAARDYGIYAPQISEEYGGMGASFRDVLPVFEQAGRSSLGPLAMRVDAPDQGNMDLLELVGTTAQKDRWLRPLVDGDLNSGISMTEPLQGGGSDPKMIKTTAERDGDDWVLNGHKWWTTQGSDADLLFVLARTDHDAHPYAGCSFFVVPSELDGVEIIRDIPHLDEGSHKVHSEIRYDNVVLSNEHLLGEENEGFSHAQERLGPARLTHCMRYSGMAERALDVVKAYATERRAFDTALAEKQAIRFQIAEAETNLHAVRTMVRHAARQITAGNEARIEVSMSKIFAANVIQDIIDTAVQFCGANGLAKDLPIAEFYGRVRSFRLVDGADEVHKRVIARDAFDEDRIKPEELEPLTRF